MKRCIRWGPAAQIPRYGKGHFCGSNTWACPDLSAVDIVNVISKGQQRCVFWLPVPWQLIIAVALLSLPNLLSFVVADYHVYHVTHLSSEMCQNELCSAADNLRVFKSVVNR